MNRSVQLELDSSVDVSSLNRALQEDPRLAVIGATVSLEKTDKHLAFSREFETVANLAIDTIQTVGPMILALAIYDLCKNFSLRIRRGADTLRFTPSSVADAIAPEEERWVDIFVAFGRPHRESARVLRQKLRREGLDTFIDEDLAVGEEWAIELPKILRHSQGIVYLLGGDLSRLSYLKSEIALGIKARESKGTLLFPFVVPTSEGVLPQLPYGLDIIQAAAWSPERIDEVVKAVASRMAKYRGARDGSSS